MVDVVIPTVGRESLANLLASIAVAAGPRPQRIIIVDDRATREAAPLLGTHGADFDNRIEVLAGRAGGPASARNIGWRASRAQWVAFLDDDVLVDEDWLSQLERDLSQAGPDVAGSQGRVRVPLPGDRRPTDWERNVAGLEGAKWITADCAYRRADLLATGGFDERFPRAYREDADLALRTIARGRRIVTGTRSVRHPVRCAPWWKSVQLQAGNADDVLMLALHGRSWRQQADAPGGAFPSHAAAVASAVVAAGSAGLRQPVLARLAFVLWFLQVGRFAWLRIAPGPRDPAEVAGLIATSIVIPFAAVFHRLRASFRRRSLLADTARAPRPTAAAVLFDRDGTLIVDVPFNADPSLVVPMPKARAALDRLRAAGVLTAVVSNQSGIALGRLRRADVEAVNARAQALLGALGPIFMCTHGPGDGCRCRKPAPGLILDAAIKLGVRPQDCVVIGDIGTDIEAARAAGARSILVATVATRAQEVAAAPRVAADIDEAVRAVLAGAV